MFQFEKDPLINFEHAFQHAQKIQVPESNAVALATVSSAGTPSVRIVYYKGMIRGGFTFYTNYQGRKARDLEGNPKIAIQFFWPPLHQQIRIEGHTEKLTRAENETYFQTRARISQIGAWASDQSQEIANQDVLLKKFEMFEKKFADQDVPCPPHWGGYLIVPLEIEFWFGKNGRLHERYVYQRPDPTSPWRRLMKSP